MFPYPIRRSSTERPKEVGLAEVAHRTPQPGNKCCDCPPVQCSGINERTEQIRKAMEESVPGKWFLVEGTLISALRWGEHCHRFRSGKKNFVDGDIDVYVIAEPGGEAKAAAAIGRVLKKDGWSEPKDRGDGIFVSHCPLDIPTESCAKDLDKQRTAKFYVDIHVMCQRKDGDFDVGRMQHLWKHFLNDNNALPRHIIFPLVSCEWGGGKSYAPAKYRETMAKWNGGEYGAEADMWLPLESKLATGDWYDCPCPLTDADKQEVRDSEASLRSRGMACFVPPSLRT